MSLSNLLIFPYGLWCFCALLEKFFLNWSSWNYVFCLFVCLILKCLRFLSFKFSNFCPPEICSLSPHGLDFNLSKSLNFFCSLHERETAPNTQSHTIFVNNFPFFIKKKKKKHFASKWFLLLMRNLVTIISGIRGKELGKPHDMLRRVNAFFLTELFLQNRFKQEAVIVKMYRQIVQRQRRDS